MASKSKKTIKVRLVSTADHPTKKGKKTGYFKTYIRPGKLAKLDTNRTVMMYDPVVRKHVPFEEKKDK